MPMERVCLVRSSYNLHTNGGIFPPRDASYYNADVKGKTITDIAWYYPEPKEKASNIKGYVAFYKVTLYASRAPVNVDQSISLIGGFQ